MLKIHNHTVEMYITNVCNLACDNCNRFNNFAFKGYQRWKDSEAIYEKWSKVCDIDTFNIMGGEPFTNPDILSYIRGVRKLWPKSKIYVVTNGTHMHKIRNMIDDLRENDIRIKISLHSRQLAQKIESDLDQILESPVSTTHVIRDYHLEGWKKGYENIRGMGWPDCPTPADFISLPQHIQDECRDVFGIDYDSFLKYEATRILVDAKGLLFEINWCDHFHKSAVKIDPDSNKVTLHDSDPVKAAEVCDQKFCHNFNNGYLYKCGPSALLPEFIKQFKVEVSDEDMDIINSYQPASPDWPIDRLQTFLDGLGKGSHIPQCKFCPQSFNSKRLSNVTVKPKIDRR